MVAKLEIDALKNKLRTNEAENGQKIKNSQHQLKIYWFLSIKKVCGQNLVVHQKG